MKLTNVDGDVLSDNEPEMSRNNEAMTIPQTERDIIAVQTQNLKQKLRDLGGTLSPVMSVGECSRNTMITNSTSNHMTFFSVPKLSGYQ